MTKEDIEKLREADIIAVAEALGINVRRKVAICPFHSDTHPSLHFNTARNSFRCYVCDKGGGPIDLVMGYLNLRFPEACRWLADAMHICINGFNDNGNNWNNGNYWNNGNSAIGRRRQLPPKETAGVKPDTEYLESLLRYPVINDEANDFLYAQRRLNPKVIAWLGVTSISQPTPCWRYGRPFYDAPSLLIPYRDTEGRLITVQGRYLKPNHSSPNQSSPNQSSPHQSSPHQSSPHQSSPNQPVPRFRFPKGSPVSIYNLPILKHLQPGEPLYIAEGCSDCWAMLSAGLKAVALPSASSLNERDIELLKPLNLHIYPDHDEAGERAWLRLKQWLPQLVRHELADGCKDFAEMWVRGSSHGAERSPTSARYPSCLHDLP